MIAATVEELTPLIGTRPACRALGASPATIYRRRRPPEPRPPQAATDAGAGADRGRARAGARGAPLASGSSTSRRRRPGRRCWTRAPICARPGRCTGSSPPSTVGCGSGAISSPTRRTRSPSCSPSGRTSCGPGTSSKLKGPAKWTYFYLYVILDVFSRYVVGWTVQYRENAQLAKALIEQATEQQQITPKILTLHADRGAPQRAKPVAFLLADLGVTKTHSRPYTSSDNPYSESNFKTLKYRPEFPARFDDIEHARAHCRRSSTGTTTRTVTPGSG